MLKKMGKLKIAFIAGLSEKKLIQKLAPLASLDVVYSIDLFRKERCNTLPDKVRMISVPKNFAWSKFLSEIIRLFQILILGYQYDCFVGCFQSYHGIWAWLAGAVWRKPVMQLVITDVEWNLRRYFCRKAMLSATACGVRGEISKQKLLNAGYKGNIEIIHNPMEYRTSNQLNPLNHELRITNYDFLSVANFAEEKDFPWMMKVLKEFKKECPNFRIALCGKGLRRNLGHLVSLYALEDNVDFKGFLNKEELADLYSSAKCFLLTSFVEGLPQTAIEALSHGTPCILTNVGDCSSLIRNGIEGFIVEHENTEMMVQALKTILTDSAKLAEMQLNADKRFKELSDEFKLESIAEKWMKLCTKTKEITGVVRNNA